MLRRIQSVPRVLTAKDEKGHVVFIIRQYVSPKVAPHAAIYFFCTPGSQPRVGDYADVVRAAAKLLSEFKIKVRFDGMLSGRDMIDSLFEFSITPKETYEIVLEGFDGSTDATDHLVKWILAPSKNAVVDFISRHGLRLAKEHPEPTIVEEFRGEADMQSIDVEIQATGNPISGTIGRCIP